MRTRLLALTICWLAAAAPAQTANPYAPALTVNDGVITGYDLEQRVLLLDALGASGDLNALAREQLTEDRLKVQAGRDLGIELPPEAVALGIEEFATARGLTMEDVTRVLETRGIDRQTMDDFVEAGLMWREVVGSRFRARATPTEAELDAAMELARTQPRETIQLAEIALPYAERGEAETLALADQIHRQLVGGASFPALARQYSRSDSAAQGGNVEPMPSARLPAAIRAQVLLLAPGQVTRPVPISGGVAILKVVAIRQERPDPNAPPPDEAAREALRQQLFQERIASFGNGYLQELLGDALIVER
jgi:peptidyl-prolyl cis-trans isomerase SurA